MSKGPLFNPFELVESSQSQGLDSLPNELQLALKKVGKKDLQTRQKGLEDLLSFISENENEWKEGWDELLRKVYERMCIEDERQLRFLAQKLLLLRPMLLERVYFLTMGVEGDPVPAVRDLARKTLANLKKEWIKLEILEERLRETLNKESSVGLVHAFHAYTSALSFLGAMPKEEMDELILKERNRMKGIDLKTEFYRFSSLSSDRRFVELAVEEKEDIVPALKYLVIVAKQGQLKEWVKLKGFYRKEAAPFLAELFNLAPAEVSRELEEDLKEFLKRMKQSFDSSGPMALVEHCISFDEIFLQDNLKGTYRCLPLDQILPLAVKHLGNERLSILASVLLNETSFERALEILKVFSHLSFELSVSEFYARLNSEEKDRLISNVKGSTEWEQEALFNRCKETLNQNLLLRLLPNERVYALANELKLDADEELSLLLAGLKLPPSEQVIHALLERNHISDKELALLERAIGDRYPELEFSDIGAFVKVLDKQLSPTAISSLCFLLKNNGFVPLDQCWPWMRARLNSHELLEFATNANVKNLLKAHFGSGNAFQEWRSHLELGDVALKWLHPELLLTKTELVNRTTVLSFDDCLMAVLAFRSPLDDDHVKEARRNLEKMAYLLDLEEKLFRQRDPLREFFFVKSDPQGFIEEDEVNMLTILAKEGKQARRSDQVHQLLLPLGPLGSLFERNENEAAVWLGIIADKLAITAIKDEFWTDYLQDVFVEGPFMENLWGKVRDADGALSLASVVFVKNALGRKLLDPEAIAKRLAETLLTDLGPCVYYHDKLSGIAISTATQLAKLIPFQQALVQETSLEKAWRAVAIAGIDLYLLECKAKLEAMDEAQRQDVSLLRSVIWPFSTIHGRERELVRKVEMELFVAAAEGASDEPLLSSAFEMLFYKCPSPLSTLFYSELFGAAGLDWLDGNDPIDLSKEEFTQSTEENVYAAHIAFRLIKRFPPSIRLFLESLKASKNHLARLIEKYFSPLLLQRELQRVRSSSNNTESAMKIRIEQSSTASRLLVSYSIEEYSLDLTLYLPPSFPLLPARIDSSTSGKKLGVKESLWRTWLLQLHTLLASSMVLLEALRLWERNVESMVAGYEPCSICYCVIGPGDRSLPGPRCKTCGNKFHSACLYKWFDKGGNATCPMCRALF